ncbi:hypothetical protein [Streptomyces sp. NBC_01477]|uniref:hypothetical protein n=1 Tax=Streptomyces sp. NBC_01477 TaxID=2976015 RepID=UPI002E34CD4C|nr:hypothetical protein [Streptomyces sp. NBC_01477]
MSWSFLVSTALGALIAVLSNLVADRTRWKHEEQGRQQEIKRQVYAEYLSALSRTDNALRDTARHMEASQADRARMATETFRNSGCYELRYQLGIIAPDGVVDVATAALHKLRDFRDAIESGIAWQDEAYREQRDQWYSVFPALRQCMRQDLTRK